MGENSKVQQAFVGRFYELCPGYFKVKQEMAVIPRAAGRQLGLK